jgi:glutaryl-CoA dehydrogenase
MSQTTRGPASAGKSSAAKPSAPGNDASARRAPATAGQAARATRRLPQPAVADVSRSLGTDFYLMDELLTPQERAIRDKVRDFVNREVIPVINDYWERAEFPFPLVQKLAALDIAGGSIQGYGCPGMSPVAAGLVALELARGDASVCTFYGVHSGLAMTSLALLGSEEQKQRWLPGMARMEKLGAFALTEPQHGSDAVALETRARRDGDHWVLDGEKRWIGNASFADVVIVWARDDDGNVGGFLVEKGTPGVATRVQTGKVAKRAVWQAEIALDGVRIPAANRLARSRSFKDTGAVLTATRSGVAWEAIGHAIAGYEIALQYAKQRTQFGKPLASFQIIQQKLAGMLANVTTMQLLCLRLSQLQAEGKMTDAMASLAKMNNARLAREVVADAREMLGGNGILLEYHIARHHADIEAVFTYEGTDTVQALIVGRDVTGLSAIAPR